MAELASLTLILSQGLLVCHMGPGICPALPVDMMLVGLHRAGWAQTVEGATQVMG